MCRDMLVAVEELALSLLRRAGKLLSMAVRCGLK